MPQSLLQCMLQKMLVDISSLSEGRQQDASRQLATADGRRQAARHGVVLQGWPSPEGVVMLFEAPCIVTCIVDCSKGLTSGLLKGMAA